MKKGDYVKVQKKPKKYKWNSPFGILFSGFKGQIISHIQTHKGVSYFVQFSANDTSTIEYWFAENELTLIFKTPICKNIKQLKHNIKLEDKA